MTFSIVIPVYNVEMYLSTCLDSVLSQTFPDWEAICVNDGSTDGSAQVLEQYAGLDRRIVVINQINCGLSVARNVGIEAANGEYVLFLDGDDWLEANALEILKKSITAEDLICFSGRRFFELNGQYNDADQLKETSYTAGMDYYNENALRPRDFPFVCVVLRAYRKDFLLSKDLQFKESIYHEDNLFTPLACYYAKKVKVINACLYNYRVRVNSITTTTNTMRIRDFLEIANELAAFFVPLSGFEKTTVYRAITHHFQVVFLDAPKAEKKELYNRCNWALYWKVSRTKLRHRINYWRVRLGISYLNNR